MGFGKKGVITTPNKPLGLSRQGFRQLSEMVALRLRQEELVSSTTHLWLSGPGMVNFGQQKTFAQATKGWLQVPQNYLRIRPKKAKIRAIASYL